MISLKRRCFNARRRQERTVTTMLQGALYTGIVIGLVCMYSDDIAHHVGHAMDVQMAFSK